MTDTKQQKTTLPKVGVPDGRGVKAKDDAPAAAEEPRRRFIVYRGSRYDWPDDFTGREFLMIQQETGIRAGELEDALQAGDVHALACLVVVALQRAGVEDVTADDVLELKIGVEGELDFEEEDPTDAADVAASDAAPVEDEPAKQPKSRSTAGATGRRRTRGSTD